LCLTAGASSLNNLGTLPHFLLRGLVGVHLGSDSGFYSLIFLLHTWGWETSLLVASLGPTFLSLVYAPPVSSGCTPGPRSPTTLPAFLWDNIPPHSYLSLHLVLHSVTIGYILSYHHQAFHDSRGMGHGFSPRQTVWEAFFAFLPPTPTSLTFLWEVGLEHWAVRFSYTSTLGLTLCLWDV